MSLSSPSSTQAVGGWLPEVVTCWTSQDICPWGPIEGAQVLGPAVALAPSAILLSTQGGWESLCL